ncbi:MAG: diphthine synthase [Candidatus Aenigmatarchaeota archaeon]
MLYIIGLGLGDERGLTLEGAEIARKCERYAELYTNRWLGTLAGLERIVGKVTELRRRELEEGSEAFVAKVKDRDVALFVPGDPLAATTHVELVLEAKKQKVPVRIIHNASIFSAVAETGLQLYKFGRTATIPFSGQVEAVKEALKTNKKAGLHTLLLLDLDAEVKLYMSVADALKILLKAKALKPKDVIVAAAGLGTDGSEVRCGTCEEVAKMKMGTPAVITVPGKLHFKEEEFLKGL